ncbi:hypothetical protein GW17_00056419, partial [Ensete ventricosum]
MVEEKSPKGEIALRYPLVIRYGKRLSSPASIESASASRARAQGKAVTLPWDKRPREKSSQLPSPPLRATLGKAYH